jgi:hypothetical protein
VRYTGQQDHYQTAPFVLLARTIQPILYKKQSIMTAPRVSFVSLGCPKALVDSERIITRLRAEGYEIARRHNGADLVVVNTCGFPRFGT